MTRFRAAMLPDASYESFDIGIRFAVRVLHAAGFETCQSCEGGHGHAYDQPSIDMVAGGDDALGFGALHALHSYELPVSEVSIVWSVMHGKPYEKLWRITFSRAMPERAGETPLFILGYMTDSNVATVVAA